MIGWYYRAVILDGYRLSCNADCSVLPTTDETATVLHGTSILYYDTVHDMSHRIISIQGCQMVYNAWKYMSEEAITLQR